MKQVISNVVNEREAVKLIKTSKNYNWEIKLYKDEDEGFDEAMERLKYIDNLLKTHFKLKEEQK